MPGVATKWKVLAVTVFGVFMVILDATVINVALRSLESVFAAGLTSVQWVLSVYTLSLGVMTPLAGFLADRYGIKSMYLFGLAVFVLGSVLSGFAPSLAWLIIARVIQGAGGGIAVPLGSAQLFAAFPIGERGLALGVFGVALIVAPALGPIVGGWLVDHGAWRWIFWVNAPIGLLGIALGLPWLSRDGYRERARFDGWGALFSSLGFGAVLYAASVGGHGNGWAAASTLVPLLLGAASLAVFAAVELWFSPRPLLDLRLFKRAQFTIAALIGWISIIALFGAEFLLPLYLQTLRGRTALQAGLTLVPLALSSAVVVPLAGWAYDKIGARPLVVSGFALLTLNTWALSKLTLFTPMRYIVFLLVVRGVALGLTVQATQVTALSALEVRELARGSALINATRQTLQSIGVAALATVVTAARPWLAPSTVALTPSLTGFGRAYGVTFVASLVALALSFFMPGWPAPGGAFAGSHAAPTRCRRSVSGPSSVPVDG